MTDYFDEVKFKKALPHFYCEFSTQIFEDWEYAKIQEYLMEFKDTAMKSFNTGALTDIGFLLTNYDSKFEFGIYKSYYGWEIIVWDIRGCNQIYRLETANEKMTKEELRVLKNVLLDN